MKFITLLCLALTMSHYLGAQNIQIEYAGDRLSSKERQQIEEFLQHEVAFYTRFGLPDTLSLKLTVFDEQKKGRTYLDSLGISASSRTAGIYSARRKEAVILGRERGKKESFTVIYHELSHHFTRTILAKQIPAWLMEGLSEYFEHCEMGKKGLKHTLDTYEQGRIRTMYMLGEVNLKTFVDSDYKKFMKKQTTEEQYAYILAHTLVTFWLEKVPEEVLKSFIADLQNSTDHSPISTKIERAYPGGMVQLEKDFATFCQ